MLMPNGMYHISAVEEYFYW